MKLIELIIHNKLDEAKQEIFNLLDKIYQNRLNEAKQYLADEIYCLDEDSNIIRMGRIHNIRRRIRRDAKGKIVVQRNTRRSAIKGYRIVGKSIRRISAADRIRRSQQLKRSWKSSRRAKLKRSLLKRKMSMRRRYSLGLK